MKKLLLFFALLSVSAMGFSQAKPKFVCESVKILSGQETFINVHVYNLPPMDLNALTFIVRTDVPVELFECSGIDTERWPFVVENYTDTVYYSGWYRSKNFSMSQKSIQSYKDGEVFTQLHIKPTYNTSINLEIELAGFEGKVIPIEVINGFIDIGVQSPPKAKAWACGNTITIKGKEYGTMWLPVQKVCMLTENYDDGTSLKYKDVPTGQYLAKDWVTPEGFSLPTTAALKEAKLPVIDKGYRIIKTKTSETVSQNNNTFYFTSGAGQNSWRVFWNPALPDKYYTDSNYPTAGWVRLIVPLKSE